MLGCEIIEAAENGDRRLWTPAQVNRVLAQHNVSGPDRVAFCHDIKPVIEGGKANDAVYDAAQVLLWLGY